MAFTPKPMLSLLTQRQQIYFPNLVQLKEFFAFDATQVKERNYRNQHPIDQILHLAIEVFGCLHKHAYVFLPDYANFIWSLKGSEGLNLFVLVTFFPQKISITL
jgi:hypothetical protein